ncbi:hypothetical protein [Actinomadura parmotrematis]|uniref:Uncharacterized protein n=1 Tax=Actinomadura parmotrematis TaxID=2864039 RepID=A0ABS7FPB9_9ACTN|nr:hypothetical protein [Actinomadura parmotrematis]MBW8482249.1 hypothetical protein [Actinomadura parmotrematis]
MDERPPPPAGAVPSEDARALVDAARRTAAALVRAAQQDADRDVHRVRAAVASAGADPLLVERAMERAAARVEAVARRAARLVEDARAHALAAGEPLRKKSRDDD